MLRFRLSARAQFRRLGATDGPVERSCRSGHVYMQRSGRVVHLHSSTRPLPKEKGRSRLAALLHRTRYAIDQEK